MAQDFASQRAAGMTFGPGFAWFIAAAGLGLLWIAHMIAFFTHVDDIDGKNVATQIFYLLGMAVVSGGLMGAALASKEMGNGARAALFLGAMFLLTASHLSAQYIGFASL